MNRTAARFLRLTVSLCGLVVLEWVLAGAAKPATHRISLPTDWSHSHVVFSQPATEDLAQLLGKDPRYWQQLHRREQALALSAEASDLSSARFQAGGNKIHRDWSQDLGSSASAGAGNYPAKFSFSITKANCGSATKPDYVVYSTGLTGSGTQASVVAFDNLYAGCSGTVPSVYWAYNTGGQILTSPVLSLDGSQVAFVQTSGGLAGLVLLKWKGSVTETVSSPGVPTLVSAALYLTCVAPCMTEVFLHDGLGVAVDDTTSSAYYDYANDIAWVGGARGWLHKITGAFKGIPTEVHTGGFPVQVSPPSTNPLSNPVYDQVSKNVFVGDMGGFLYRVASATGTTTKSAQLDHGTGLVEGLMLDVTSGLIYAFASSDGTAACTGGVACAAVYKLTTTFASGAAGTKATVGNSVVLGSTPNPAYRGAFDSTYLKSMNATGNLYVCGNTGGTPTLYRIAITAGTPANGVAGPVLSTSTTPCSPVTGFANPNAVGGATEWVFVSADTNGSSANPSACAPGGCIFNFKDTPWQASHAYTVGQEILDSHFQIQAVSVAGTSAATTPAFSTTIATTTTDGGVTWENQGVLSASTAAWKANTGYAKGVEIWDSNRNVELQTKGPNAVSGATAPAWSTTIGGSTIEGAGGPHWTNLGPIATYGLKASGGTGGIIIDNTVTGAVAGSQVYFSTLSNQVCGTSGTGGCAVQASQSKLQ
jgi:hypothetical protein